MVDAIRRCFSDKGLGVDCGHPTGKVRCVKEAPQQSILAVLGPSVSAVLGPRAPERDAFLGAGRAGHTQRHLLVQSLFNKAKAALGVH